MKNGKNINAHPTLDWSANLAHMMGYGEDDGALKMVNYIKLSMLTMKVVSVLMPHPSSAQPDKKKHKMIEKEEKREQKS